MLICTIWTCEFWRFYLILILYCSLSFRQEGKSYKREVISVTTAAGNPVSCYTYIMHEGFGTSLPSKPYLDTLIEGAREHDVPKFYIEHLEKLEHNEYSGPVFPR